MSRQEKSDVELVKLVLSGECEAYSALVQRYEKLVFSFLLSRMNSIHDIEDIVQDSFVKAYKHLASFDCERKFSAWLLTIARNIMIDSRRKSSRDLPSTDLVNDVLLTDSAKEESEQPADILIRFENGKPGKYFSFFMYKMKNTSAEDKKLINDVIDQVKSGVKHGAGHTEGDAKVSYEMRLNDMSNF